MGGDETRSARDEHVLGLVRRSHGARVSNPHRGRPLGKSVIADHADREEKVEPKLKKKSTKKKKKKRSTIK